MKKTIFQCPKCNSTNTYMKYEAYGSVIYRCGDCGYSGNGEDFVKVVDVDDYLIEFHPNPKVEQESAKLEEYIKKLAQDV